MRLAIAVARTLPNGGHDVGCGLNAPSRGGAVRA